MKNEILSILNQSDGYISGEKISQKLNISRAAVWKHIKALKNDGFIITSVTNKGYMLLSSPDIIDTAMITEKLSTSFIGKNIIYYDKTDSTNIQAKLHHDEADGTVFIADLQTGGKGSHGRNWSSPKGMGIWLTILLKPTLPLSEISQITLVAGLAACKALGDTCKIKWPNDIVIGSKKLCGILTEMSLENDYVNYVVCGIGLNVNNLDFPDEISHRATSMKIEFNKSFSRNELIIKLLNEFEKYYSTFTHEGLSSILDEYKRNCVTLNREVNVIYQSNTVRGTAIDINENGALVIDCENKKITVSSGEVSVRGIYGYV